MAGKKIGIVLALDGEKEFRQGMSNARKESQMMKSEINKLSAEYEGNANSLEYLRKKQEALEKQAKSYESQIKSASAGLKNAESVQKRAAARYEELKTEVDGARKALEEMAAAGQEGSKEYKAQEKSLQSYEKALAKQEDQLAKCEGKITDWQTKINNAESGLTKANNTLKQNEKYLKEAENATDGCASSIDEYGNAVKGAEEVTTSWGEKLKSAVAAKGVSVAADLLADGVKAVGEAMTDVSKASTQLAAKTGLSETAAKKYAAVMKQIKGDNYGEDYQDVADAMAEVIQIMGQLDDTEMVNVTESALTLRDVFGMDINESIRAADVMMNTMGVDAQKAFDLITTGAQNGLNRSGELVDNITEYGQLWGQAGFSAEEMFAILDNGLNSGAYNLDKVNDYVKEFGNSLADGRIQDNLSSFSTDTQNLFAQWQKGEASTRDVFYSVINDLSEMENQQQAVTLASTVWSALGEDNAMQVITALDDVNDKYKDVKGSMDDLKDINQSDLESAVSGLGSAVQEHIVTPLADLAIPAVTTLAEGATAVIEGIADAVDKPKTELQTFIDDVKASNEEVQGLLEDTQETMSGAEIEVSNLEAYKQTLTELAGAGELNTFQQYQAQTAINALSDAIPALKDAYDDETKSITMQADEIAKLIESQEKLVMQNAAVEARESAYKALFDAQLNVTKSQDALNTALSNASEELGKNVTSLDQINNDYTLLGSLQTDTLKDIENADAALQDATKTQDEAQKSVDDLNTALEEMGYSEQDLTGTNKDLADSNSEVGGSAEDAAEAQEQLAAASQAAAQANKEALSTVREEFGNLRSDLEDAANSKLSLFDAFDGGKEISLDDALGNIESFREGMQQYYEDLDTLAGEVGNGFSAEFFSYLQNLGPDGANLIHEITEAWTSGAEEDKQKVQDMIYEYLEAMDMTSRESDLQARNQMLIDEAFNLTPPDATAYQDLLDGFDSAISASGKQVSEETKAAFAGAVEAARQVGAEIPESISEMLESGNVEGATAALAGSIQGKLEGLAQIASESGLEIPAELAAAIESGDTGAITAAYEDLMSLIRDKSGELAGKAAEGLEAGESGMTEAAASTAQAGATAMTENAGIYTQAGEEIGDSIIAGIQNKGPEIQEAIADVLSAGEGTNKNSAYMAIGEAVGDAIAQGVGNKKEDIKSAISGALASDGVEGGNFSSVGEQAGNEIAAGIASAAQAIMTAAADVMVQGATAATNDNYVYNDAGGAAAEQYAAGITGGAGGSVSAGGSMASRAAAAVSAYQNSFYSAGVNMASGVAGGINAGASGAINAAASMASRALSAAKAALDIHSPSKKFQREVGEQISAGMAFGIKNKASLAGKQAKKMSNQVYKEATSWLSKYKKSHQVSLADEKYYWEQVIKHTKKGTTAYNNALKKLNTVKIQQSSGLSSSIASKIAGNFGVERTTTTGSGKKKKTTKKSDADYYSEIYSAAKKYIDQQQILNDWSLQQQLAYWTQVRSRLKSGTDAWYDATAQIKDLQEEQAKAAADAKEVAERAKEEAEQAEKERLATHAQVQDDILSKYKTYYKVSAKAEADYWNIARQQFKAGTDERIEADQKYFDALQTMYEERKELDEEYAENSKDINDQLIEDIEELQDAYKDAVASRKEDILSQMNLFEAWDSSGYDADTLLYNLKTQVAGLALWEQQLEELEKKGLASGLLEELKEMGPDAAANIYSLNQMTAEQLAEYNKLWEQKEALAESQAVKDNEALRQETNSQISQLRSEAQAELAALNAEYQAAIQELNTGISADLRNLVNKAGSIGEEAVSGMIGAIGKAANSVETYNSTTKVVSTVSSQLSALAQEGTVIGESTLDGILAGMLDYTKINDTSKEVIQSIKRAMEDEAEIHSPARLFRRETGPQIPAGVAEGIADGTETALRSSREMIQDMFDAAEEEMYRQQAALQTQAAGLNYSGITKLNRALESYQMPQTVVNVDNSSLASLLGTLIGAVNNLSEKMDNQQMVMDTGALVAAIQPQMDKATGDAIITRNRGRYR